MPAERLYEAGVVNVVSEPGEALDAALALAARVAPNAPLALAATKRVIEEAPDWPRAEMWERQEEITEPVFASEDAREGATAFAEKRAPVWRGR
jgi:enoyl-CoA hydratase